MTRGSRPRVPPETALVRVLAVVTGLLAGETLLAGMQPLAKGTEPPPEPARSAPAGASADQLLQRAEEAYYQADLDQAMRLLDAFLTTGDLVVAERIRGLELRASCLVAQGEPIGARGVVEQILDLDHSYLMQPDIVPPQLLRIFFTVLRDRGALRLPTGIRSVAVMDLRNTSVTDHDAMEPLQWGLAHAIMTDIAAASRVWVVERERLNCLLEEVMELPQRGAIDEETAARAGKLVGAQSFLLGGFTRIGDKLRIDVRLVETERGVLLKTHMIDGKVEEIFDLVHQLARLIVEDLGEVYERPPSKSDASLGALLEYADGLALLDAGDLIAAEARFRQALEHSPDYAPARRRIKQLAPLLALQGNR